MLKKYVLDDFRNTDWKKVDSVIIYNETYRKMRLENLLRYFHIYTIFDTDDPMLSLQYNVGPFQSSIESLKYLGILSGYSKKIMERILC